MKYENSGKEIISYTMVHVITAMSLAKKLLNSFSYTCPFYIQNSIVAPAERFYVYLWSSIPLIATIIIIIYNYIVKLHMYVLKTQYSIVQHKPQ